MPPDDDLIDAAPCPSCRAPLTIAAADLGHLVECPSCGTRFRARRPEEAAPPPADPTPEPREERDEPPPRRREDDRPVRRPPPRFDDYDDRPGRRPMPRYEDDYDDRYVRRRGGAKSGAVIAVAVLDFIYGGLILILGVLAGIGGVAAVDAGGRGGGPMAGLMADIGAVYIVIAVCFVGSSIMFIVGGVGCVQHRSYGRVLSYLSASVSLLLTGLTLVGMVMSLGRGGRGDPAACICPLIMVVFWLGHAIPTFTLLGKTGREFR